KQSLDLLSVHVTVKVEGPRARTLVDYVFRNPHDRQLEGTFECPLPAGASPSYFTMFLGPTRAEAPARFARTGAAGLAPDAVAKLAPHELVKRVDTDSWGKLQVARVVSQDKALETYENIVRRKVDPGLLEHAGGNTFRGRVYPIAPKGFNRVVLAYEETLPVVAGRLRYSFALPGVELQEMRFSLRAPAAECKDATFLPRDAERAKAGGALSFTREWKVSKPSGEVVFSCEPATPRVQATSGLHAGSRHLFARLRPDVPGAAKAKPFAEHAVFLLDTSLSEAPDRFA